MDTNERAASEIVGYVLIVGLSVTVSVALVGAWLVFFDTARDRLTAEDQPDAEMNVTYNSTRGQVNVTHVGGDTLLADHVVIRGDVENAPVTWGYAGVVTIGYTQYFNATSVPPNVTVVYTDGENFTLARS